MHHDLQSGTWFRCFCDLCFCFVTAKLLDHQNAGWSAAVSRSMMASSAYFPSSSPIKEKPIKDNKLFFLGVLWIGGRSQSRLNDPEINCEISTPNGAILKSKLHTPRPQDWCLADSTYCTGYVPCDIPKNSGTRQLEADKGEFPTPNPQGFSSVFQW